MDNKEIRLVISTKEGLVLKKLSHMRIILKKMKDLCTLDNELSQLNDDYQETNNTIEVPNIDSDLKNFMDKIVQLRQEVFNLEFNSYSNILEFEKIIKKYENYVGISNESN